MLEQLEIWEAMLDAIRTSHTAGVPLINSGSANATNTSLPGQLAVSYSLPRMRCCSQAACRVSRPTKDALLPAGCLHVEARTLQARLLPAVRGAGAQVKGLLLGLVRDSCAAVTTDLTAKAAALAEQPTELQPYMQLQARNGHVVWQCACVHVIACQHLSGRPSTCVDVGRNCISIFCGVSDVEAMHDCSQSSK